MSMNCSLGSVCCWLKNDYTGYPNATAGPGPALPHHTVAGFKLYKGKQITPPKAPHGLHTRILPGETIRSPSILVAFVAPSNDTFRSTNLWRRLMLRHFNTLPINESMPVGQGCIADDNLRIIPNHREDAQALIQQANVMREKGASPGAFSMMWIDAGWYSRGNPSNPPLDWGPVGNWSADPYRFNGTLRPVSNAVHAAGQKLLVWFEPERVVPNTVTMWHGWKRGWIQCAGSECMFLLSEPAARQYMRETLSSVIGRYGIDIYRQDNNIGSDMLHWVLADPSPDRRGSTEARHIAGLYEMWDGMRRDHPKLLMDTCAGGAQRVDIEVLTRQLVFHRTDWGPGISAADPFIGGNGSHTLGQAHNFGMSLWLPLQGASYDATWTVGDFRNASSWLSMFSSTNSICYEK